MLHTHMKQNNFKINPIVLDTQVLRILYLYTQLFNILREVSLKTENLSD